MHEYYSIGEVAKMVGVESHTIRFWAGELSAYISPQIGAGGRRYFSQKDVDFFASVHEMVNKNGIRLALIKKNGVQMRLQSSENMNLQPIIEKIDSILRKIQKCGF